ncbi:hypothetical protein HELRODRAFT_190154 [Helobdella robusta]|uniref:FGFR1 oncogene partner (FOP) N-terminal dimerisation domain-containing protein n=1 Tax=Helobdella robusta TaxID=6412 RepID=T1FRR0_HELRO|nr:hypothetical protein HELRODRAFT_190154 [Helobdella robusta]ESO10743.1 hypothetical protein HELRODRAFT_190154 [Helobdella robusta]
MSVVTDEDSELRDVLIKALENAGVLGKIRAQLRASVFLALEKAESEKKITLADRNFLNFAKTSEGNLIISLILDFLKVFNLDCTLSIFEPEAVVDLEPHDRDSLCNILNLKIEGNVINKQPIICHLLKSISLPKFPNKNVSRKKDMEKEEEEDNFDLDRLLLEKKSLKNNSNNVDNQLQKPQKIDDIDDILNFNQPTNAKLSLNTDNNNKKQQSYIRNDSRSTPSLLKNDKKLNELKKINNDRNKNDLDNDDVDDGDNDDNNRDDTRSNNNNISTVNNNNKALRSKNNENDVINKDKKSADYDDDDYDDDIKEDIMIEEMSADNDEEGDDDDDGEVAAKFRMPANKISETTDKDKKAIAHNNDNRRADNNNNNNNKANNYDNNNANDKSNNGGNDDGDDDDAVTTDHTISPSDISKFCDYVEDVIKPPLAL